MTRILDSGKTLLHYRVVERLGEGGMGEVYRAEDMKLGRNVAIKLLRPEATEDEKAKKRLIREARAASALNHPNIVTIFAIEEAEGLDFITMEYVEGETLREKMDGGPLEWSLLADLGLQVARALDAAHGAGIVHRDIKPSNILTTRSGHAKVADFGLAATIRNKPEEFVSEEATFEALTKAGFIVGTLSYMSPEQVRGEILDGQTDIFSLGCVLYEAATGKTPFGGATPVSIINNVTNLDPPPPSTIRQDLPRDLDWILSHALAKDKVERFSSAAELAEQLEELRKLASSDGLESGISVNTLTEVERQSFVGREVEIERLDRLLQETAAGSGKMVFITGDPGIGKSTLADEFLRRGKARLPRLICGRGRCLEQFGSGEAYLPFLDALGALLAGPERERVRSVLRRHAPTWCLQLPAAFPTSGEREQLQGETIGATKERMLREMGDALGALTASSPMILLLEDLHWADLSSIDLLRHLCQRIMNERLMVVGTLRPADLEISNPPLKSCRQEMLGHGQSQELGLGHLSIDEFSSYLDARFDPNDFPEELPFLIHRKTEGHPLFATSLVQFLVELGHIAKRNEHWSLPRRLTEADLEVPESVRGMIRKQMEALSEEDRRALQYASVQGEEFLSTVLAALLDADELALEERLDTLDKSHRLIRTLGELELPDGQLATRYRFAHALYQNALYGELVSKRRVLLHRKAGEQLVKHYGDQALSIAHQLAVHFERGRELGRAVEYLIHAGDNAAGRYANAEANEHYSRALNLSERLPAEERTQRFLVLYQKRGDVYQALSCFDKSAEDFTHMSEWARANNDPLAECGALNGLVYALYFSHRVDEMDAAAKEAMRAAERAGSQEMRATTMVGMAIKHMAKGQLMDAKSLLDESIRIARAVRFKPALVPALVARAVLHYWQTEYEASEKMESEVLGLASELRDGFHLVYGLFFLGILRANLGRLSEALSTLHETMEFAERNGDRFWLPRFPNAIGWIHRELNDFDGARHYDERSREMAHEYGVLEAEANALINIAHIHMHMGETDKTAHACSDVEDCFERDDWYRWRYNIRLQAAKCENALTEGDLPRAKEDGIRLLETATHYDAHKYIAVAHKLLAELAIAGGELAEAETELTAALEELRAYPAPLVAWKTYALLGRLRLQLGDSPSAREAYSDAADIIRMIASNVSDENLRATFLNSAAVQEVLNGSGEG